MLHRRTPIAAGAFALLLLAALLAWRGRGGEAARTMTPRDPGGARGIETAPTAPAPVVPEAPVRVAAPSPTGASLPGGSFEGRVVSAAGGAGIAGAELTFSRAGEATVVESGGDGAFRFAPRLAGRWTLAAATAPRHLPFAPEWGHSPVLLDAREGAHVRGIVVTLSPAIPYQGRVVTPAGEPVAGAEVRVLGAAAGEAALLPLPDRYTADAAGAFTFVAPDDAVLEARHPGHAPARETVDFAARVARRLTLTLRPTDAAPPPEGAIAGRVEDGAGTPASGAVVMARSEDDSGEPARQALADAEGRFELPGLPPGTFRLVASRPGLVAAVRRGVAPGARDVVLRLAFGGSLSGRVRDRATAQPVAPFTVVVRARGRRAPARAVAVVDASGRYVLHGIAPGPAAVLVAAPGRAPSGEVEVTIPEPGQPPAVADFDLGTGGRIRGAVRDARSKAPIAGADIAIEGQVELGPSLLPVRARAATGADGSFELSGVPDRLVSLQASAEGHHARLLAGLVVGEGEVRGPVAIELSPLLAGEEPRVELTGIGATLAPRRDALVVTGLAPGGGAAEAGLATGDEIVRVDGRLVDDLTFDASVNLIRGPEGSSVVLGVRRRAGPQRAEQRVVVRRGLVGNQM